MTLGEVIEHLQDLDPDATIYAAKPWTSVSPAIVAFEPDDGSIPQEAAGLDYFLEVFLARDAAEVSNARTPFERVMYFRQNDAFLFDSDA